VGAAFYEEDTQKWFIRTSLGWVEDIRSTKLIGSFPVNIMRRASEAPPSVTRSGSLSASTTEDVLTTTKPIEITKLEFATNYDNPLGEVGMFLSMYNRGGTLCHLNYPSHSGGVIYTRFSPEMPSSLFQTYLTATGQRFMGLRPGVTLIWPFGGKIRVNNGNASSAYNVGVSILYRELEVI
jgi:hypothetical protein